MVPRLIVCAVIVLAGCATQQPEYDDLSNMRVDCANARFQLKYLEGMLSINRFDPDRGEYDRRIVANANRLIWEIRSQCYGKFR